MLEHLRQPMETADVRVDTGVRQGDQITPYYDPMIAKLIVWGSDRTTAARRLEIALEQYEVVGVQTNLGLLRAIAGSPAFVAADLDTGFIGRHIHADATAPEPDVTTVMAAALAVLEGRHIAAPVDPWDVTDSFRLNGQGEQVVPLRAGETTMTVSAVSREDGGYLVGYADRKIIIRNEPDGVSVDGVVYRTRVVRHGDMLTVFHRGRDQMFELIDPLMPPGARGAGSDRVVAPIPARVTHVLVHAGDVVAKGAALIVLEAMKMEITLIAPRDGTVDAIRYAVGDMVEEGTELVQFAEADGA
jgi:3-methylcrotonyl-CoA carboxylase alpha subunit